MSAGALRLLVIDTCGRDGTIALVEAGGVAPMVRLRTLEGRSASERLLPELRAMMAELGWMLTDLAAVAVVSGPGSFTGVRVGMAAAKGLCEASALPLVAVSRLHVLAATAGEVGGVVHAVLSAGRGEFFYRRSCPGEEAIEALLTVEAVRDAVRGGGQVVFCEEAVAGELAGLGPVLVPELNAADGVGLILQRVRSGDFDDVALSDANYLRRTDLEVKARLAVRAEGR